MLLAFGALENRELRQNLPQLVAAVNIAVPELVEVVDRAVGIRHTGHPRRAVSLCGHGRSELGTQPHCRARRGSMSVDSTERREEQGEAQRWQLCVIGGFKK